MVKVNLLSTCIYIVLHSKIFRRLLLINLIYKLDDLTVQKRSPDLINIVKIGQDQLQLIIKHFVLWGLRPFWSSDLKQSNE